jgi:hypothetical protein
LSFAAMLIVCIASFAFAASHAFDLARKSFGVFGADGETAGSVITLEWEQLIPPSVKVTAGTTMRGIVEHSQITALEKSAPLSGLVSTFNGKQVRIAGFVVPLVFDQTEVNEFLLVPFVGACIHVPPPPPNQMILVRSHEPVEIGGLYDPIWVTGEFQAPDLTIGLTAGQSAGGELVPVDLVSVGYEITARSVEEYEWDRSVGAVSSVCRSCVNSLHSRSSSHFPGAASGRESGRERSLERPRERQHGDLGEVAEAATGVAM